MQVFVGWSRRRKRRGLLLTVGGSCHLAQIAMVDFELEHCLVRLLAQDYWWSHVVDGVARCLGGERVAQRRSAVG